MPGKLNLTITKKVKMRKGLQHKRFMKLIEILSSTGCYWYAQASKNIVPISNESDSRHQRPDNVHT